MLPKFYSKVKDIITLSRFNSIQNLRKLCCISGITNLITCFLFYYLYVFNTGEIVSLIIFSILLHTYLNSILIFWSIKYNEIKLSLWMWLSLVPVIPVGIVLVFYSLQKEKWIGTKKTDQSTNSIFSSLTNSVVNVDHILERAINNIMEKYPKEFTTVIHHVGIDLNRFTEWDSKSKHMVIALSESIKRTRKHKINFNDIVFGVHWYDQKFFDFAVIDPKSRIIPNHRYKYSFGFVVLDEFNNYQKILDGKKEIKSNMRFGPAKAVCLHWGKGFKVFVNE